MPRDTNGNYTLPVGNPVVADTSIESVWANTTLTDVATELTNSLSRDGNGGMRAPFEHADGNMLNPGMSWGNEPTSGWYRKTTNEFWYSVGNEDIFGISKNGIVLATGKTFSGINIQPFPAGTRMLFNQTAAPPGWTKVVTGGIDNNVLRIVTGAVGSGGADDFTAVFGSGKTTQGTVLTAAQMPSHTHSVSDPGHIHYARGWLGGWTSGGGANAVASVTGDWAVDPAVTGISLGSAGGGQAHTHPLGNMDLKYQDVIIATKD